MYPVLFEIGNFQITTFGVMMFLSFITAAWFTGRQLERYGMSRELAWDMLAWVAIGGILGAKLYYLALHWEALVADPVRELLSRGGLVWYGGLIGGVVAYYIQVRARKLPTAVMFDATAPALAIAYAVGRLGCFLVGDDYGVPTDAWYGVAFPQGAPPSTAGNLRAMFGETVPAHIPDSQVLAVHPTQLYEIVLALGMFALLWYAGSGRMALHGRTLLLRTGQLFSIYMMLYAVERFLIEFVRAKGDRIVFGLSTSQAMSVMLLGLGVALFMQRRNAPPAPLATRTARPRKAKAAPAAG
jgi:phosphatidylglycerol---prolipoprotein diacylglyceryl transferase